MLNRLCRTIIKTSILLVLFLPLLVYEQLFFPFVFPRMVLFRVLIEISTVCYLTLAIVDKNYRPRWTTLTSLIVGLFGIFMITSFIGPNWHHSFWSTVERSEGILAWAHYIAFYFVIIGTVRTKEEWKELFVAFAWSGVFQLAFAIGQFFNLKFALRTNGERLSGSIGNPIFLSSYLIFLSAFIALIINETKIQWLRYTLYAYIALCIFIIWQASTRGAIIALFVGAIYFIIATFWKKRKIAVLSGLGIILVCSLCLIIASPILKQSTFIQKNPTLHKIFLTDYSDITTQNRLIVWNVGLQSFLHRPLQGYGLENFSIPFNIYFDTALTRDIGSNPWYDRSHNMFIEIAVASGIFGLMCYLAIFIWSISLLRQHTLLKNRLATQRQRILVTLFITYCVQNFFAFDTFNSYMPLFLVFGYIYFLTTKQVPREDKTEQLEMMSGAQRFIALLLIILLVPCIYYFNVRPALANYYTVDAVIRNKTDMTGARAQFEKAFSYSPPAEEEFRFIMTQFTRDQIKLRGLTNETAPLAIFAINEMENTIKKNPDTIQNYLLLGELYLIADRLNPEFLSYAEKTVQEAVRRGPRRYQTYTLLGRIQMSMGKPEKGIEYFKQAIALNDRFAESYWNLGIAYILNKEPDKTGEALATAEKLGFTVYTEANIQKLFNAFKDARDLTGAIDFLKKMTERYPNNSDYAQAYDDLKRLNDSNTTQ